MCAMKKKWTLEEMTSAGGKANTPAQKIARAANAAKARQSAKLYTPAHIAKMVAGRKKALARKKQLDIRTSPN
jgi:hypothetical protein